MISLVAALTHQGVIGLGDHLPWHIPEEIRHFRGIIRGQTVIMGRNTYEVMKGHLETAHTIVISHRGPDDKGIDVCTGLEEAISKSRSYGPDAFIVGGAHVFSEAIKIADRMQLSYIKKDYEGDMFFPEISPSEWEVESREDFPEFEYVVYARKKQ